MSNTYKSTTEKFYRDGIEKFNSDINSSVHVDINTTTVQSWFDPKSFEKYSVEEVYWVSEPFEYVRILRNDEDSELIYDIVTPEFENVNTELLHKLQNVVSINIDSIKNSHKYGVIYDIVNTALSLTDVDSSGISKEEIYKIGYEYRDMLHKDLRVAYEDSKIEEISFNEESVNLYHTDYSDSLTCNTDISSEIEEYIERFLDNCIEEVNTMDTFEYGPVIVTYTSSDKTYNTMTIKVKDTDFNPVELIQNGMLSVEEAAYLWSAVLEEKSIFICGEVASGKTSLLNALSFFIPDNDTVSSLSEYSKIKTPMKTDAKTISEEDVESQIEDASQSDRLLYDDISRYTAINKVLDSIDPTSVYTTAHADSIQNCVNRLTQRDSTLEDTDSIDIFVECVRYNKQKVEQISEFSITDGNITLSENLEQTDDPAFEKRKELLKNLVEKNIVNDHDVYRILSSFNTEIEKTESVEDYLMTSV